MWAASHPKKSHLPVPSPLQAAPAGSDVGVHVAAPVGRPHSTLSSGTSPKRLVWHTIATCADTLPAPGVVTHKT